MYRRQMQRHGSEGIGDVNAYPVATNGEMHDLAQDSPVQGLVRKSIVWFGASAERTPKIPPSDWLMAVCAERARVNPTNRHRVRRIALTVFVFEGIGVAKKVGSPTGEGCQF